MLNIPFLANNIKYDKVCYVYIFQNTHIVAYDEIHMHTPPKSFHPSMEKTHTNGQKQTRGTCE